MKITIEPTEDQTQFYGMPECLHCKVTVEIPTDELTIWDFAQVVRDAVRAWGYSDYLVNEVFGEPD